MNKDITDKKMARRQGGSNQIDGRGNSGGPQNQNTKEDLEGSSDAQEKDTEKQPAKVTNSEMAVTRLQGKRKQNKKQGSCDRHEQDAEEPTAKVSKS